MKKLFKLAFVSAAVYAVYRAVTGQQATEALWQEATRDLDSETVE